MVRSVLFHDSTVGQKGHVLERRKGFAMNRRGSMLANDGHVRRRGIALVSRQVIEWILLVVLMH
jgi:hypothetical protein